MNKLLTRVLISTVIGAGCINGTEASQLNQGPTEQQIEAQSTSNIENDIIVRASKLGDAEEVMQFKVFLTE